MENIEEIIVPALVPEVLFIQEVVIPKKDVLREIVDNTSVTLDQVMAHRQLIREEVEPIKQEILILELSKMELSLFGN